MTLQQMLILEAIEQGVDRVKLIADRVGMPVPSVWTRLHELKRRGLIAAERVPVVRKGWLPKRGRPIKRYVRVQEVA
jgi:predicted ArsR family transcriptional regulator